MLVTGVYSHLANCGTQRRRTDAWQRFAVAPLSSHFSIVHYHRCSFLKPATRISCRLFITCVRCSEIAHIGTASTSTGMTSRCGRHHPCAPCLPRIHSLALIPRRGLLPSA